MKYKTELNSSSDLPFDFSRMDTSLVSEERVSDERLLMRIKTIRWAEKRVGGWGLVAELCKRYARKMDISL